MISQETVGLILDTAQIVDVVGDFVALKRRGANYTACCPFHNEKTPSFYVSPSKGLYKCFGCGKSGTAVGFVMDHENLDYPEALRYLAKKYGIKVEEKELSAEDIAARQRNESLMLVSDFAKDFYASQLESGEGRVLGYQYFKSRGLEDGTISKFGLGWAPKGHHSLSDAARAKGFKDEYLVDTGLCVRHDNAAIVDRFYERAMFPIHSVSGRVIAFGGRTLRSDKTIAKYINSPETEIYDKSRSLYGIYFAKSEISRENKCLLVEGYLDVLTMHQLGVRNVVASSGTSLTVPQIQLIHKFTENVTIMYDGDPAGIHAALRGIGLVLREGLNVKVVLLPEGEDPDSYGRKHSLEQVRAYIAENEKDFIAFKTDLLLSETGGDPLKRAELINDIADTIALIPDPVKRQVYAQSSAEKFSIDSQVLFARIRRSHDKLIEDAKKISRRDLVSSELQKEKEEVKSPEQQSHFEDPLLEPSEKELLWFILNHGNSLMEFPSDSEYYDSEDVYTAADFIRASLEADNQQFANLLYRRVYNLWFSAYDADLSTNQEMIAKMLMDGEDREVANLVAAMTQEKYQLTVQNFAATLTATKTMLVNNIPKSILAYNAAILKRKNFELLESLKKSPEQSEQILSELQDLALWRKTIEQKLRQS